MIPMQSATIGKLVTAMSQAQGEMRAAPKSSDNPFFKSKYTDLFTSVENVREILARHGLAVMQSTEDYFGTGQKADMIFWVLRTKLAHTSGEYIDSLFPLTPKNCAPLPTERNPIAQPPYYSPQAIGSCVSYARRYTFCAIINQVSGNDIEDDDGNAASGIDLQSRQGAYNTSSNVFEHPPNFKTMNCETREPMKAYATNEALTVRGPNDGNNVSKPCTDNQVYKIGLLTDSLGWDKAIAQEWLQKTTGKSTRKELTKNQASEVIDLMIKLLDAVGVKESEDFGNNIDI